MPPDTPRHYSACYASTAATSLLDLVVGIVKDGVVANVNTITATVSGGKAQPNELVTVRRAAHS